MERKTLDEAIRFGKAAVECAMILPYRMKMLITFNGLKLTKEQAKKELIEQARMGDFYMINLKFESIFYNKLKGRN